MARRRRRERNAISSLSLGLALSPLLSSPVRPPVLSRGVDLREFEDRRRWTPNPFIRTAAALPRSAARIVVAPRAEVARVFRPAWKSLPPAVAFAAPKRVVLCVRRKRRREVLFAKGKGGGGHRRPRRNAYSYVEC